MAWRTCDLAIKVSGLDYKALSAYLCDGITWSRLRHIATTGPAHGGLQMMKESSQECKDLFGKSPCAIIVSRPDTDLRFLKLLAGKERLLLKLAEQDLQQRALSAETQTAVLNLGNIKGRISRRVLQEILERCMFILHFNQKHPTVASCISWHELLRKAVTEILDLACTPSVLERFGWKDKELQALEETPITWVHLAVLEAVGEEALVMDMLQ